MSNSFRSFARVAPSILPASFLEVEKGTRELRVLRFRV